MIDDSLSQKVEVTYEPGHKEYQYKRLLFDPVTWDGIDRVSQAATSVYTVITDAAGNLVTMFPGVP